MESLLFELICRILNRNQSLLDLAIFQQAKFEGWLKFELANELKKYHSDTCVEKWVNHRLFDIYSNNSLIELKTPNTSYKFGDDKPKQRPITNNVQGITYDIQKLNNNKKGFENGYIAFVMFPVVDPEKYHKHIKKVEEALGNTTIKYQGLAVVAGFNTYVFVAKVF